MAYCTVNFKTKKELKEAIKSGMEVEVFSPGPFGCKTEGIETVEGPHYPKPHTWYARVEVNKGLITKVLK